MIKETFKVDIDIATNPYVQGWTFEIDFTEEGHELFLKEVDLLDGKPFNSDREYEVNSEIYNFIDSVAEECLKKLLIKENDPMIECNNVGVQWEWIG